MTTFTDKELIKEIKERIGSLDVRDNIERRAYEIALASLEADPVAYIFKHPAGKLFWALTDESNKEQSDVIPVYAAAPASVVPDNASEPLAYAYKELTPEIMRNHLAVFERYGIAPNDSSTTIQALRIALDGIERSGAMLHGAEPVSQTYKFPVNTPCQDAPAHIWLQTAGVWPEDGELSELTWCSHNQHHDDTLYVRADLVNGNSPGIPDGWVIVPKKLTAENGAKGVLSGEFSETTFISCPECFGDDDCETCDCSGRIEIKVPVSWTTIKTIWAKGCEHFSIVAPQQDG
ncbi:DUF551 domain-containing protein [Escherichia coli]|nr:DUF551 domain-containing protein [Escherichia coli]